MFLTKIFRQTLAYRDDRFFLCLSFAALSLLAVFFDRVPQIATDTFNHVDRLVVFKVRQVHDVGQDEPSPAEKRTFKLK